MARLFVPPDQLAGPTLELRGDAHRYLTRVLRLRAGDAVTLFDGVAHEIAARIVETSGHVTRLALGARRPLTRAGARITLLQAIPRGERMDLVVQKATELGVHRILPVLSARTVVQPGAEGRMRRWRTIAQEAARQCGRADLPDPGRAPAATRRPWPPWPTAPPPASLSGRPAQGAPLRRALRADEPALALLVGPEGGFSDQEVAAAQAAGLKPVGLGPLILRSETAAIVALALATAATGGLDS